MESQLYVLIIGGTSGLGLALHDTLSQKHAVMITGRKWPEGRTDLSFLSLNLTPRSRLGKELTFIKPYFPYPIDLLIFAAGAEEDGNISQLPVSEIEDMITLGLTAPIRIVKMVLSKQDTLPGFIAITSTSQDIPRLREPVYTAVKAGLAMFANSLSLDPRVGKVLVAAPGGMKTRFWRKRPDVDQSGYLDAEWVAQETLKEFDKDFKYRCIKLFRGPARVEVQETR